MQRGERDRALAEFERARALAPDNAGVALHLAAAYRKFGEPARAESVLLQQLTRTPNDARLRTALADLRLPGPPAAAASRATPCGLRPPAALVRRRAARTSRHRRRSPPPSAGSGRTAAPATAVRPVRVQPRLRPGPGSPRHAQPDAAAELRAGFAAALEAAPVR